MAALAAADITVVISSVNLTGRKRRVTGTITFGDGSKTYTTAGIPLPAYTSFGFYRQMESFDVVALNGLTTDYFPTWVPSTNKLQLWVSHDTAGVTTLPFDEAPQTAAPAARTYSFEAWGW